MEQKRYWYLLIIMCFYVFNCIISKNKSIQLALLPFVKILCENFCENMLI